MKRIVLFILMITLAIMPITVRATDDPSVGDIVGDIYIPTISANSLEDFTKKLNELKADDLRLHYIGAEISVDDIYSKVIEAIASGENNLYLPSVDSEITGIVTYVVSDYGEKSFPGQSSRYSYYISQDSKIALNTSCSFRYNNMTCRIGYGTSALTNKVITLRDKTIPYALYDNSTTLYFEYVGVDFMLHIGKSLTEEEIKALPKEMFTPKIICLDILATFNVDSDIDMDNDVIAVDDPKESNNVVCEE